MQSLDDLIKTVEKLRSPEGCPWDKEQTFKSLVPCIKIGRASCRERV